VNTLDADPALDVADDDDDVSDDVMNDAATTSLSDDQDVLNQHILAQLQTAVT